MNYRKYSLFNLIGAMIWGAGLTYLGYLLGYIPPVKDFVVKYIDLILLGAVAITLIPTIYHYIQSSVRARRRKGEALDDEAAAAYVLKLEDKRKAD